MARSRIKCPCIQSFSLSIHLPCTYSLRAGFSASEWIDFNWTALNRLRTRLHSRANNGCQLPGIALGTMHLFALIRKWCMSWLSLARKFLTIENDRNAMFNDYVNHLDGKSNKMRWILAFIMNQSICFVQIEDAITPTTGWTLHHRYRQTRRFHLINRKQATLKVDNIILYSHDSRPNTVHGMWTSHPGQRPLKYSVLVRRIPAEMSWHLDLEMEIRSRNTW